MPPRIVFLDRETLPVPVRAVNVPHEWAQYPLTTPAEVVSRLEGAQVAITNKVPLDAATIAALPALKLIAVAATGYNQVDLVAARQHGVTVCNIRDYAIAGVAEHALMLMLALKRQLPAYRHAVAAGDWQRAPGFCLFGAPMHDLAGGTLVLLGSGTLAQATANLAQAFGMRIVYAERKGATQIRTGYRAFEEALAQADVLSLHCPLNEQTRNVISARELALLKPGCVLINTARGGLVDEAALLAALQSGQLGGAGLDVLIEEPPRNGNPLLDVNLPNLIITPHVAWASVETMSVLAGQLIDNIEAFLRGEPRNVLV
ncbi:D-2-hydroxyacid dehydrogenase [Silvimonas iriomotensis]|uniref:Glycerate dehydrogenase n=1 Tax=Silvimonas iriomotensis TaxID=449662 RepID=A0ABQ2P562_9NEIS|nr:D-2-hydroxyacid dehydrogenase [Silvimonas iriomotensis]GGP18473.1 glycerate dehydrogenase [Silvimonas iriomotensis]